MSGTGRGYRGRGAGSLVVLRIIAASLCAGLLLGLFAAACGDERGPVGSVTTLGDSLNVGTAPYLADELDGWTIDSHDRNGRRTAEGVAELRDLGRDVAPVLVLSLGTNDFDIDPAAFRAQVEGVLELAGPRRCVVWSTIWLDGPHPLNDALRDAASRHENLELADWAGLVADDPSLLAFDGVHGSPEGYERRAELIADIVRRCLPEPSA